MKTFNRGLDDTRVEVLNKEYEKDGWWKGLVHDPELFLAIRDGYVNVYFRGCSLLRWDPSTSNCEVHYKYLLQPDREPPYIKVEGGKPVIPEHVMKDLFIPNIADHESLKKAAEPYAEPEKTGVHNIIFANENILDVEIALGKGQSKGQIDLVALQETDRGIDLVFFEAKRFANKKELRAKTETGVPKVVKQVEGYSKLLHESQDAIRESYRRVCMNLTELRGLDERYPERYAMMKRIVDGVQSLYVDEKPRLVVFDFDDDQADGKYWKRHLKKLNDAIGEKRVLLRGDSKGFQTGISKY